MEEYAFLFKMGFVVALILLIGLTLRVMGFRFRLASGTSAKSKKRAKGKRRSKKNGRKRSSKKPEKEIFYQQAAYVDDGGGDTEWQDSDMYDMKEGKSRKRGFFDNEKEIKDDDKYESWDNY